MDGHLGLRGDEDNQEKILSEKSLVFHNVFHPFPPTCKGISEVLDNQNFHCFFYIIYKHTVCIGTSYVKIYPLIFHLKSNEFFC